MTTLANPIGTELLDDPAADSAQVSQSLRHIARANRWFGGSWAVGWAVRRALAREPTAGALTLLDVGAGSGDLAAVAVRAARKRGTSLRVIALERHRTAAAMLRDAGWSTVLGDASALPFRTGSVDWVLASQMMHHFSPAAAPDILAGLARVARRAVLITDLRRSALARLGFAVAARALRFDSMTRHDGDTSIRRGYSVRALEQLLTRAGIPAPVARRPGWRLVSVWSAP
ncbi:MAG TPA: methyltransferase domain-containing protein [Gemmatimonadales bacterium]|nr:methyltransferase domain-containing protein [Gemmatimonadales bacterium]